MDSAALKTQRVLLVEDSALYAELLQDMVRSEGGDLELQHCGHLWDAADILLKQGAECVLLDLSLPDATGLVGLEKLRSLAPEIPIVVLTALNDEEQAISALKAGAQDYLPKEHADGAMILRAVRYAVERAELNTAQAARDRAETLAGQLQRALLPDGLPSLVGVELAARYVPRAVGANVGGDWYDVVQLPGGEIGVAIGDVVGHGPQAATLMGQLRTALRAYAIDGHSPADVLAKTDWYSRSLAEDAMATALFMAVNPERRTVRIASAGHVPPLLVGPDGVSTIIDLPTCSPLGVGTCESYSETVMTLEPGATLVLCTDGLVESRRCKIAEGLANLADAAAQGPGDPEQLCDHILALVTPDGAGDDDVALVVMRFADEDTPKLELSFAAAPSSLSPLRSTIGHWLQRNGATPTQAYEFTVAISEAAANAIEHAYPPGDAEFELRAEMQLGRACVSIADTGRWRPPRSGDTGRGLILMDALTDQLDVAADEHGTTITLARTLGDREESE